MRTMHSLAIVSLLLVMTLVGGCAGAPATPVVTSVPPTRVAEPASSSATATQAPTAAATVEAKVEADLWGKVLAKMQATTSNRLRSQITMQVDKPQSGKPGKFAIITEIDAVGEAYFMRIGSEVDGKPAATPGMAVEEIQHGGAKYVKQADGSWPKAGAATPASDGRRFGALTMFKPADVGLKFKGKGEARGTPSNIYGMVLSAEKQMEYTGGLVVPLVMVVGYDPTGIKFESFDAELYVGAQDELPYKMVMRLRGVNAKAEGMNSEILLELWDYGAASLAANLAAKVQGSIGQAPVSATTVAVPSVGVPPPSLPTATVEVVVPTPTVEYVAPTATAQPPVPTATVQQVVPTATPQLVVPTATPKIVLPTIVQMPTIVLRRSTPTPTPCVGPCGYIVQPSYAGNCAVRPAGTICITFRDGYTWLVEDAVQSRTSGGAWDGKAIEIAVGVHADYYHVTTTNYVKRVPK